jgi:hypothetical protein
VQEICCVSAGFDELQDVEGERAGRRDGHCCQSSWR